MEKIKRSERLAVILHTLMSAPNQVFRLGYFGQRFGAAKSTLSEDIALLADSLRGTEGQIETIAGASGGVRYRSFVTRAAALAYLEQVAATLSAPERVLPGGYLYLSDFLSDPDAVRRIGAIIASQYYEARADFVLTMETRGIPFALMTADALHVPLITARRTSRVYEGSAVNITYPSPKGAVETMSLSRRAVKEGQRALIVDDFMREGGTARGMVSLMKEFGVTIVGMCFVLAKEDARRQPLPGEKALLTFSGDGETKPLTVRAAAWLRA